MSPQNHSGRTAALSLHPTRYDRVASLLISMLVLSGTSVAMLGVIWLTLDREANSLVKLVEPARSLGDSNDPAISDFETPDAAELSAPQFCEPALELSTLLSSEMVAAVTNLDADVPSTDKTAQVDSRSIGDLQKDVVPRWERWEIRYESATLQSYSRQLDFFGIELGAAGGGKKHVDYAANVSAASPTTRSAPGTDETRLYMTWRGGKLEKLDRQLLKKAGIETDGRIAIQFYPQKIDDMLAMMESKHREDGRVDEIKKTIFGVRPSGEGFEFFIIEQR